LAESVEEAVKVVVAGGAREAEGGEAVRED
jgi:hypothetical protein